MPATQNNDIATIYVDGASRGNPGDAACAGVIEHSSLSSPFEFTEKLGKTTNNIAEYQGLLRGLEFAKQFGFQKLQIYSDSQLMVRQVLGEYQVKNEGLKPLYQKVIRLLDQFESVQITHVLREKNKRADQLCNQTLDQDRDKVKDKFKAENSLTLSESFIQKVSLESPPLNEDPQKSSPTENRAPITAFDEDRLIQKITTILNKSDLIAKESLAKEIWETLKNEPKLGIFLQEQSASQRN